MNLEEFEASPFSKSPHFMLIGHPASHSLSPLMHNTATEFYGMSMRYFAIDVEPSGLGAFAAYLNNEELKGVNVTIPYKQLIMDYVDECDNISTDIGAVNTIIKKDLRLIGSNTDAYGFLKPLEPFKNEIEGGRAIVFGTGGASKAIVYALNRWGVEELILVSRNPEKNNDANWPENVRFCSYDIWTEFADEASLIVNATPLGMSPDIEKCPIKSNELNYLESKICYDIVYRPLETTFLKRAEEVHARTIGGLEMLIHQGSRSFELWTGKPFPIDAIREKLYDYLQHGN